jgi:predicted TIM-barrel fold metal-dependent hydrolase
LTTNAAVARQSAAQPAVAEGTALVTSPRLPLFGVGPDDPARLLAVLERLGSDRMLLFSTDYPHHQFDDPSRAAPALFGEALARFLGGNARETYRLAQM